MIDPELLHPGMKVVVLPSAVLHKDFADGKDQMSRFLGKAVTVDRVLEIPGCFTIREDPQQWVFFSEMVAPVEDENFEPVNVSSLKPGDKLVVLARPILSLDGDRLMRSIRMNYIGKEVIVESVCKDISGKPGELTAIVRIKGSGLRWYPEMFRYAEEREERTEAELTPMTNDQLSMLLFY